MGQNISFLCVKRRRAKSSQDQYCEKVNMQRKLVDIPDKIWLESLKFLTYPQWSQKRFACRQINGIAQCNISCLPKMVIDSAYMLYNHDDRAQELEKLRLNKYAVVAFDEVMQEKQSTEWFEKRGFAPIARTKISPDNLLIAADNWIGARDSNLNICIHGAKQERIVFSKKEKRFPSLRYLSNRFRKPILFYAQFNPVSNQYSSNYLAQFLKFIYHPASYIKEVEMFAVNQKFIDSLKCNIGSIDKEPRYIRCESFVLKLFQYTCDFAKNDFKYLAKRVVGLHTVPNMLKWLTRNVRTDTLNISLNLKNLENFVALVTFLLDPSGAKECATNKVKINVSNPVIFLNVLIDTFRTSPLIEGALPAIEFFYPSHDNEWKRLGPNLIDQEVYSQGTEALHIISNGKNRMRISFRWEKYYECKNLKLRM